MIFVEASENEQQAWDSLIKKSGGSIFSESIYLNAVSDSWTILYNNTKTGGIACPFSVKGGMKILHSPIFHRYSEWIGEGKLNEEAITKLKEEFPVCDLNVKEVVPNSVELIHQIVDAKFYKLNQLAKRSLKKSENYTLSFENHSTDLLKLIEKELIPRIYSLETDSLVELSQLVSNYMKTNLKCYSVLDNEQFVGGIWVLENETTYLYLKGTCSQESKKNGGMFLLMNTAIQACLEAGKTFDFGGSNADNVKRFNYHFGAQDCVYSHLSWNSAPFWWKGLKRLKKLWNSR